MPSRYLPFVDWLKSVGIFLIVCGHVAAAPTIRLTPPVYPKQLGVALFVFILGFSLAGETRPRARVVFNRVFDMYLYAVPLALLISSLAPFRHTLNLSNYLPFVFGANVLFNNFPANPTTWFVGTYLHILVVWALLVRFPIRGWMLIASVVIEVAIRTALAALAGGFVAYMSLFNWATVFLGGMWFGQRLQRMPAGAPIPTHRTAWTAFAALAVFASTWALWVPGRVAAWSFPFAALSGSAGPSAVLTATGVSAVYLLYTLLFFQAARRLPALGIVRFFARNTLVVFLAHMPVFYVLEAIARRLPVPYAAFALVNLAICFVGLSLVSEGINRALRPRELRDRVAEILFARTSRSEPAAQGLGV